MASLSNPICFYRNIDGSVGVYESKRLGVENSTTHNANYLRYQLDIDPGESGTHMAFQIGGGDGNSLWLIDDKGDGTISTDGSIFRCVISDDENAYRDVSNTPEGFPLLIAKENGHYMVKSKEDEPVAHLLFPGKTYYLWLYHKYENYREHYCSNQLGWVAAPYISLTLSGVAATYTVAYDAAGGSGEPEGQTKNHGEDLVLSDMVPTKKGHSFLGWAIKAGGEVAYQPGDTYATDAAVTLYAVWQVNQYTDTFDPNGGTGGGSFTGDYDSSYTAPSATRPGYLISGWWSAKTGGSKVANPGQTITHNANNDTAYAQWKVRTYTISCNPNGGVFQGSEQATQLTTKLHSGSIASIGTAEKGITTEEWAVNLDPNGGSCPVEKVVTGGTVAHIFTGWYDQQGNRVYDENGDCVEGKYWQSGKWAYDDDLQISAWYRKDPVEFTPVKLPKAERAGYRFLGWSADPQDQETVDDSYVPQSEGITLYAVWEALVVAVPPARILVYARGRFRPYRVLVNGKPYMVRLGTRTTTLTVTHDGNGTVTIRGNVSVTHDGNGNVTLSGVVLTAYEDGVATIKGGI